MSDFTPPGGPPPPPPPPPDQPPGPGWWKASDGNWYPPEQAPQYTSSPSGQPYGQSYQQWQSGAQQSNGLATWALALGIASIVLFWTFGFGILLGVLAVIFGVIGRNRANELPGRPNEGRAKAGLITGILGIVGGVLFFAFLLTIVDDVREEIEREQDDGICDPDTIWDPDC